MPVPAPGSRLVDVVDKFDWTRHVGIKQVVGDALPRRQQFALFAVDHRRLLMGNDRGFVLLIAEELAQRLLERRGNLLQGDDGGRNLRPLHLGYGT